MPSSWTSKDERQYQKIRRQKLGEGVGQARAKEIAARTVNKKRRKRKQRNRRRRKRRISAYGRARMRAGGRRGGKRS